MRRKIITIDEEKCNGCGLCVDACHEGAIVLENGKAKLLRDDYCDGLGDCLPACPTEAIRFEEREAAPYDEEAVKARMAEKNKRSALSSCACPGSDARVLIPGIALASAEKRTCGQEGMPSQLKQWPIQIKLTAVSAPYFNGAHLLVAADCTAYAHGDFHNTFMRDKITLIACPKLDETDYSEKLAAIIQNNNIQSITLVRMEVPCCGGLENAVREALLRGGKSLPLQVKTITRDGGLLEE